MPTMLQVATLLALVVTTALFLSYRRRLHRLQGREVGDPIPTVALEEFDEVFVPDELGPTRRAEVRFIGGGGRVPAVRASWRRGSSRHSRSGGT